MGYLNPLLSLPAARALLTLDEKSRAALAALMLELRRDANIEAERAWKRRKGPMACYWRAVSTYARHVAHVLRRGAVVTAVPSLASPEFARLQSDLDVARRQVAALVEAASVALPMPAHPRASTPESWARQLRNLGQPESATQLWLPLCDEPVALSERDGPPARVAGSARTPELS